MTHKDRHAATRDSTWVPAMMAAQPELLETLVLAVADLPVFAIDSDDRITFFSEGAERLLGYSAGEMLGRSPSSLLHPGEPTTVWRSRDLKAGDSTALGFAHKNGSLLHAGVSLTPMPSGNGVPGGYVAIVHDLSSEIAAREEAARTGEQFRVAFDASPVPACITRLADGEIRYANQAMVNSLGWQREDLVGRTTTEMNLWANPESHAVMVERLTREGHIHAMEGQLSRREGVALDMIIFRGHGLRR